MGDWKDVIPADIRDLYEVYDYRHASTILKHAFPTEFDEICAALRQFRFTVDEVKASGGNESEMPKKISRILRPSGWKEDKLKATLLVDEDPVSHDTHKIDYVKGRVALDLEWNSKDQTYDRDLYAFSTFWTYNKISVAVLITRGKSMEEWFKKIGTFIDKHGNRKKVSGKYGASTTHMNKLLTRLDAGRNGGCPVLVFGITPKLSNDPNADLKQYS